jgi:hypothetical protein
VVKKLTEVVVGEPAQLEQVLLLVFTLPGLLPMVELAKYPLLLGLLFTMLVAVAVAGITLRLLQVMAEPAVVAAEEVIIMQDQEAQEQIPGRLEHKMHRPLMAGQAEQIPEAAEAVLAAVVVAERLAMADQE